MKREDTKSTSLPFGLSFAEPVEGLSVKSGLRGGTGSGGGASHGPGLITPLQYITGNTLATSHTDDAQ
jgi:hypothetical protein